MNEASLIISKSFQMLQKFDNLSEGHPWFYCSVTEKCTSKVFFLRVSLAFISVNVKPSSSQTSVAVVVLPTPGEPHRRAAFKDDPSWSLLKKKAVQNKNV